MVHFFIQAIAVWYFTALVYFGWQHYEQWRARDNRIKKSIALFRVLVWVTAGSSLYLVYRILSREHSVGAAVTGSSRGASTYFTFNVSSDLIYRCFRVILGFAMVIMAILRVYRRAQSLLSTVETEFI